MNRRNYWNAAIVGILAAVLVWAQPYSSGLGRSLASALIWVGNASGVPVAVAMSGDATIANTGAVTLASTVSAGSCTTCNLTYDAKGRITVAANGSGGGITWGNVGQTFLWGGPAYTADSEANPAGYGTGANAGIAASFTVSGILQFTNFILNLSTAGTSGQALMVSIYNASGSTIVCASSVLTGAGNIDTTGRHALTVASGSLDTAGTCNLTTGGYKAVWTADNTSVKVSTYYGATAFGSFRGTGTTLATVDIGYASALSTSSGASLAPVADISAKTFAVDQGVTTMLPILAVR